MAKKSSSGSFREIISDINQRKFSCIYLLMGDEDYFIDIITEALESSVVDEEEKDFNYTAFYGADVDIRQVVSRSQQFPLMSEKQLVMLKEAQAMQGAKTQLEKLIPYVNHANPNTILVITYKGDTLAATSKLIKAIETQGGVIFKSDRPKDYQLNGFLADYCREKKVKIDEKSLNLLCEYIGSPLSKLFGEVDKLIVSAGSDKTITPELIESIIGISKEYNSFELIKSLAIRDFNKSMKIVDYFSRNPKSNPTIIVVSTIFNFYSKLFIASINKDKSDQGLMACLDLKSSYSLTDYRNGIKYYKAATIDGILHEIRNFDVMSKGVGSLQNEYSLLKELIFKIFTLR